MRDWIIDRLRGTIVAAVIRRVSPRHRRWRALLESLTLEPGDVQSPRDELAAREFVICGCPRTGTSLAAAQLFQPPEVITVMEPWDGLRIPPGALFASLHEELDNGVLRRGRLDVEVLLRDGSVQWTQGGEKPVPVSLSENYFLGVKWPTYWQLLDRLTATKFIVCLRHPVEVVASFASQAGRLSQGLQYEVPFNRDLNRRLEKVTDDPADRRAQQYALIHEHELRHLGRENVFALRYERWFDAPGRLMEELGEFLGVELTAGPAAFRRPPVPLRMARKDMDAVQRRCRSVAEALGYDLDDRSVILT